jgi:general secretion pathway protein D
MTTGGRTVKRLVFEATVVALAASVAAGCATGRAFSRGQKAARAGDWDQAVTYYREALQRKPDSARYQIELQRAMESASRQHEAVGKELEQKGDLEGAVREYRVASDYAPSNRALAAKASEVEQTLRERIEASRPKPKIEQLKDKIRLTAPEPMLNPTSRVPIELHFPVPVDLQSILSALSKMTGISIVYDRDFQPRNYAIDISGVTLEQALQQIFTANQLFYKVLNERTIIVAQDSAAKRSQYEDQVIQTFFISHADVTELQQALTQLVGQAVGGSTSTIRPVIWPNKTANTITVRGSSAIVGIIEQIIEANDKPRAEIVVDVEILEVNRTRAKQYGLNLSAYSISLNLSPESNPATSSSDSTSTSTTGQFNVNTITRGIDASDFYLAVPSAVVKFLETDSETKLIAKPQLRGQEGKDLTLNLGDSIPIPSTTYTPIATGGVGINPLTSFTYKDVGVNVALKAPRVTYTGDIIMELSVESSSRGQDVNIAGQNLPSFGTRKVTSTLRLRDGESNLLAGLLREDERKSLQGFPGAIHTPVLRQLFSGNDNSISQTDIVMLLTPHIVRSHEVTEEDLKPIYIGTGANPSLGGPPSLIGQPPAAQPAGAEVTAPAAGGVSSVPGETAKPAAPARTPPAPPVGTPVPGLIPPQPAAVPTPPGEQPAPAQAATPPAPLAQPAAAAPAAAGAGQPAAPAAASAAQVMVSSPSPEMRIGAGPYTVVVSISDATRVSTVSFSLTFDPKVLRVRGVNQGSFMSQGGLQVAFAQQVDSVAGRVDITLARTGDAVGASGSGSLAVVLFEAASAGNTTLNVSGVAAGPDGAPIALKVTPAGVTVR